MFYYVSETKYVTYWLNCAYSDPMTIYYKSRGSLVLPIFGPKMVKNNPPPMFYLVSETKYVTYGLKHRSPMTIYYKVEVAWSCMPILGQKWLKTKKRCFTLSVKRNMLHIG